MIEIMNANALTIPLADESVDMCVTSPPYWGLRNYQVSGQLGLEPTPEEFVQNMVNVFREVWRVLKQWGTCWVNLGDSYNGSGGAGGDYNAGGLKDGQPRYLGRNAGSLKPKDLCGIPWRVAFALQADGWYLRQDIIWAKAISGVIRKGSAMPESVRDRFCKSHEYVFLLTKNPRYYFDTYAVADTKEGEQATATRRSVWLINTKNYSGAHFATYPPALVEPCIKAGTSEKGVCAECGRPWERVTDNKPMVIRRSTRIHELGRTRASGTMVEPARVSTTGWRPACTCNAPTRPAIVLDPFAGSGTTGLVARQLGRSFVGLDLSYPYLHDQARKRLSLDALNEWQNGTKAELNTADLPLFQEVTT